jgi:hypothetical protein
MVNTWLFEDHLYMLDIRDEYLVSMYDRFEYIFKKQQQSELSWLNNKKKKKKSNYFFFFLFKYFCWEKAVFFSNVALFDISFEIISWPDTPSVFNCSISSCCNVWLTVPSSHKSRLSWPALSDDISSVK